jgi:glycolate oxidase FAD binding subunit
MSAVPDTSLTLRPSTLAGARDAMRDSPGPLLLRGGGTKLGWGASGEPAATVVETTDLDPPIEHNAGDMTAAVGAGMRLSRLQAELSPAGQWLAVDPPSVGAGATVGGIIASGDCGPRRLRYGPVRDIVIGMTVVLSDGAVARSGGRVIKNVAGYDVAKLFCGSFGTLGLIAEVVLRLHPLPDASSTVRVACDPRAATRLTLALLASPTAPVAIDWAEGALWVRFQGRVAGVAAQSAAICALAADHGFDADVLTGAEEAAVWGRLTEAPAGKAGETVLRAATIPDRFAEAAAALGDTTTGAGADAALSSHCGLGIHTARLRGGPPGSHAAVTAAWRRRVGGLGGHVVVRRRRDGEDREDGEALDTFGPPPPTLALMRRVKEQLDPRGRCGPGRFVGGL